MMMRRAVAFVFALGLAAPAAWAQAISGGWGLPTTHTLYTSSGTYKPSAGTILVHTYGCGPGGPGGGGALEAANTAASGGGGGGETALNGNTAGTGGQGGAPWIVIDEYR